MSYIKSGLCDNCGETFYWSIGHPAGWSSWSLNEEDWPPVQQWWYSFGNLCPRCAPPRVDESPEIEVMYVPPIGL